MRDCAKPPALWYVSGVHLAFNRRAARFYPRGLDQMQAQLALRIAHSEELLRDRCANRNRRGRNRCVRCPRPHQVRRLKQRAKGEGDLQLLIAEAIIGDCRGERRHRLHRADGEYLLLRQRVVVDTHVIQVAGEVIADAAVVSGTNH